MLARGDNTCSDASVRAPAREANAEESKPEQKVLRLMLPVSAKPRVPRDTCFSDISPPMRCYVDVLRCRRIRYFCPLMSEHGYGDAPFFARYVR